MQSFHSQLELHGLHGMVMKAHHDDNNNSSGGAGTKDLLQHPALQQHHPHLAHQAAQHHHGLHPDSNTNSPVVVDVLPPAYTSPAAAPGASPPSYHLAASRHQDSDSPSKASKAGLGGSSSSGEESKGERALWRSKLAIAIARPLRWCPNWGLVVSREKKRGRESTGVDPSLSLRTFGQLWTVPRSNL